MLRFALLGAFTAAKLSNLGVPFWIVIPVAALITGTALMVDGGWTAD